MELLQLRYLYVVAKHQNMTKAAAELMVSQPALGKTIIALKKKLGTPLFDRRNRSTFLNRAGGIFYQEIDRGINLIDGTVSEVGELSNEPFGSIKLLVLTASSYVPEFYIAFHQRHPYVRLQLSNYIHAGHLFIYDCGFHFATNGSYTPLAGNCVTPILTRRFVLAVHEDHPLASRTSIRLKETASYPFMASNRKEDLEFYCLKAGFRSSIIAECGNGTTYEALMRHGVGIFVTPETTLGSALPHGIVYIPLIHPVLEYTISLSYGTKRRMSNAECLFKDFCMEYFKAEPVS